MRRLLIVALSLTPSLAVPAQQRNLGQNVRQFVSVDAPLVANMIESGRSPVLPKDELVALGFTLAIYPGTGMCAMAAALNAAFTALKEVGHSDGTRVPLASLQTMHDITGFPAVWALEEKWQGD